MIKVPGYYGDMNINDPVIKTPGKELYLHLIQDCPCCPTQPLSNGFILMGFSFSFVKSFDEPPCHHLFVCSAERGRSQNHRLCDTSHTEPLCPAHQLSSSNCSW